MRQTIIDQSGHLSGRGSRRRFAQRAGVVAAGLVLALGLAGCGGDSSENGVVAPVTADLTTIDGTTVTVPVGGTIDLTGDDETFTEWTADIDDPDIVSFTPGKKDGSASFNPGLSALKPGDSDVTLTNGATGDTVSFEVEVTDTVEG